MSQKPFHFKQFSIQQNQSAMKVGTDGVLLGAWTATENTKEILDVGSGTGLIALMLAQRTTANITAIELEEAAAQQAQDNFATSAWSNKLNGIHQTFQEFVESSANKYDLIVSNPPFFNANQQNSERNTARSQNQLSFRDLIEGSTRILGKEGRFCVVLPIDSFPEFNALATRHKLFLNKRCNVKGKKDRKLKRVLLEYSFIEGILIESELCIENKERHDYTVEYRELLKEYLTIF